MNRAINSIVCVGLILLAAHAPADDSMGRTTMTKRQMMNDCIQKQKTADVSVSKAEMKRICKDQLKQQKTNGTFPDAPPTDTPRN